MSCCGQKRKQSYKGARQQSVAEAKKKQSRVYQPMARRTVYFEYTGRTGLTVTGSATNKRYRFAKHGARVAVDGYDGPALVGIPNLRRVNGPN